MDTPLLYFVYDTVRDACKQPSNVFGLGIWTHHIRPMIETAKELAPLHDADLELVLICVLLHDYAGIADETFVDQHHIHGANEARRLLTSKTYPDERIAVVEDAICSHRGSVPKDRKTNEARCLADCDAISHIQQFPSLFYVTYKEQSRSIEDGADWVTEKLKRDWNKLSSIGRDYIRDTYDGLMSALSIASQMKHWKTDEDPNWGSS